MVRGMSSAENDVREHNPSRWQPARITIVSLLLLTGVLLLLLLALSFFVPFYGLERIHRFLPEVMAVSVGVLAGLVIVSMGLLTLVVLLGRDVPFSMKLRSIATRYLLPVLVVVGRAVGLRREEVQHAFVAVNNDLVLAQCRNGKPLQNVLLLLPHCLQDADCTVKITHNVQNCKRCGKCPIKDLLELSEKYGIRMAVATGGTSARRTVMEQRPDLIIAVACERDLTSGIQDTTPLPVYGIFNERPFGPCFNTQVAIDRVDAVLRDISSMKRQRS